MAIVTVPPIKSQGIKTKLVPWINDLILTSGTDLNARWIEPFFGTGVVGFNSPMRGAHIVGDTNPHIINFYRAVQNGEVTQYTMRAYLENESRLLAQADDEGYAHFRLVRDRFNQEHSAYDFIFLSRAGFNGMMRFNRHGDWNIPFCKKPVEVNAELLMANKVDPAPFEGVTVYGPGGCPKCRGSGYKGRGAFMEVLPISPKIRGLIERGGDAEKLKEFALQEGMVTLKEAGMRKVRAGVTSLEAAFEVTGGE